MSHLNTFLDKSVGSEHGFKNATARRRKGWDVHSDYSACVIGSIFAAVH